MSISDLEQHYGKPYNRAYFEIKEVLKKIEWFRKSVRDIRGYKVENWSNFTDIVKDA